MDKGKAKLAFVLAASVMAMGYGCAANDQNVYQVRGQTGQVVRDIGGHAGQGLGAKAAKVLGHTVTEDDCRQLRAENMEKIAAMQRGEQKPSQDEIASQRAGMQKTEADCDRQAQETRNSSNYWGNFLGQIGRIGGDVVNKSIRITPR